MSSYLCLVDIYIAGIFLLEGRWVFMGKCMRYIYELRVKRLFTELRTKSLKTFFR